MQCLWLENGNLRVREIPKPSLSVGDALIKLRLAGICRTDLELVNGYYPYSGVLGHEFVGDVVDAPGDTDWIGKRVVGRINASCGQCTTCLLGRQNHCPNRTVLGIVNHDGVFAEYFCLPIENLYEVPRTVPDELAVFTEPLAAACRILEQVHIRPSDNILVVGAGRLGQLIAQLLATTGCNLRVIARYPNQRLLLSARGIDTVEAEKIDTNFADVVVEATGSPDGYFLARKAIRPQGTIVVKSTYRGETKLDISSFVVDEINLVGSRCGPFPEAIRLLEQKQIDPLPYISARLPLVYGLQAFQQAACRETMKVLLQPSAGLD